jgi:hypothetical protein
MLPLPDDLLHIIADYVINEYRDAIDILEIIGDENTVKSFPCFNCIINEIDATLLPDNRKHTIRTLLYTEQMPFEEFFPRKIAPNYTTLLFD